MILWVYFQEKPSILTAKLSLSAITVNTANVQKTTAKLYAKKNGLVSPDHSCGKFAYSPLKRVPVKQLNFVGSMADEELYLESAGDRAEKNTGNKE